MFFLVLSLSGTFDSPEIAVRASGGKELAESQGPTDERGVAFLAVLPEEYRRKVQEILDRPDGDPMKEGLLNFVATETPAEMGWIENWFLFATIDLFHDPSVIRERVIGNLPIAMSFLLPLFALTLAAFYIRKGRANKGLEVCRQPYGYMAECEVMCNTPRIPPSRLCTSAYPFPASNLATSRLRTPL